MTLRSLSPSPAGRAPASCFCEPLEGRRLLAADLVASQLIGKFPETLISGERGTVPALRVVVNNSGTNDATAQNFVVQLYASANGTFEPTADFKLSEVSRK